MGHGANAIAAGLPELKIAPANPDVPRVFSSTDLDTLSLVPPGRFGRVLTERRWYHGINLDDLAGLTGGRFATHELADVEAGRSLLHDDDVALLCEVYGVELELSLRPRRTRLTLDPEQVAGWMNRRHRSAGDGADDVLTRYLGLIVGLRGAVPGTTIALRQDDVEVLSDTLWIEPDDVEARLAVLMTNPHDRVGRRARRLARRAVIPEVGIMVAATADGLLVLDDRGDDPSGGFELAVRSAGADIISLTRHEGHGIVGLVARSA